MDVIFVCLWGYEVFRYVKKNEARRPRFHRNLWSTLSVSEQAHPSNNRRSHDRFYVQASQLRHI